MGRDIVAFSIGWLLWGSLQVALLAVAVWLITRCCPKSPASLRYRLWLLVLLKAFIPPILGLPAGLAVWQKLSPPRQVIAMSTTQVPGQPAAVSSTPQTSPAQAIAAPATDRPADAARDLRIPVVLIWTGGAFVMCLVLATRVLRQGKLIGHVAEADPDVADLLVSCAERMGIRRVPRVGSCRDVAAPMLVGVFRPMILLPEGISSFCSKSELSAMLLHELAHLRRCDMFGVWFYQLAQAVFFFHPAVWLAGRELDRERELACDEMVLSSSIITRQEYARGYVSAVKLASSLPRTPVTLGMAEPLDMEVRRLKMILNSAVPRFSARWLLTILLIALIGLPTFYGFSQGLSPAGLFTPDGLIVTSDKAVERAADFLRAAGLRPEADLNGLAVRFDPNPGLWIVSSAQINVSMDLNGNVVSLKNQAATGDSTRTISKSQAQERALRCLGYAGSSADVEITSARLVNAGKAWDVVFSVPSDDTGADKQCKVLLESGTGRLLSITCGRALVKPAAQLVPISSAEAVKIGRNHCAKLGRRVGDLLSVSIQARKLSSDTRFIEVRPLRLIWSVEFRHQSSSRIAFVDIETSAVHSSEGVYNGLH